MFTYRVEVGGKPLRPCAVKRGSERHTRLFLERFSAVANPELNLRALSLLVFVLLSISSIAGLMLCPADQAVPPLTAQARAIDTGSLTIVASPASALVGEEITFFANASSDIAGSTLTFTIFYDYLNIPYPSVNPNSAFTVNTTSNPGNVVTKHTYDNVGNYSSPSGFFFWVYLFVSDGLDNQSNYIQVPVNFPPPNLPPEFTSPPEDPLQATARLQKNISILISDPNTDTVTVFWDFGDGTSATNVTVAPPYPPGAYVNVTHIWDPKIPGEPLLPYYASYWLNVTISDGINDPVTYSAPVNVSVGVNYPPTLLVQADRLSAIIDVFSPVAQFNFTANASDPEGDPLTWTFNYSDGSPLEVFHSNWTVPEQLMWRNTTHFFSSAGKYMVNISVSDALVPNQVSYHNVTVGTLIQVALNVPPYAGTTLTLSTTPEINGTRGYVDVDCSIQALDDDGDVITLTWSLDGVVIGTNVSAGGTDVYTFVQTIRFNETGLYNISVTVTDGRPGHEAMRYKIVNVTSTNLPPEVLVFNHDPYVAGDFATPNESVTFHIVISDPELDTIELVLDFGDGSPRIYLNLTVYVDGNVTALLNHTYTEYGNYTVRIYLTDNKVGLLNHTKTYELSIRVWVRPPPEVIKWDAWDFASLGLTLMIPVVLVIWFLLLRAQRKRIENQGMTYDEWKLRSQIKSEELKKR